MDKSLLSAREIEALTFIYDAAPTARSAALHELRRKWTSRTSSRAVGAVLACVVFTGLGALGFLARTPPDTHGL